MALYLLSDNLVSLAGPLSRLVNPFWIQQLESLKTQFPAEKSFGLYLSISGSLELLGTSEVGPDNYALITSDTVGVDPYLQTPPWGIEVLNNHSFLWLGRGSEQGIKGILWSPREQTVQMNFEVAPGPAQTDPLWGVELALENQAGFQTERQWFDTPATLTFKNKLQAGVTL